jgi:prepilin-type processing-associated H-X9-DG protein
MVISIITLLVSILLPTLQRVNRHAKAVTCRANLRQWGTTLALYLEDNEGRFPGYEFSATWLLTGQSFGMANPNEPEELHRIRTKGMLCPMATKPAYRGGFGYTLDNRLGGGGYFRYKVHGGSTFGAWEFSEPGPAHPGSYGLNTGLLGKLASTSIAGIQFRPEPVEPWRGPVGGIPFPPNVPIPPGRRYVPTKKKPTYIDVFSMRRRDGIPLLFDCKMPDSTGSYKNPPVPYEGSPKGSMWRFCMNRHDGHINCLFLDWSVRKVGLKELWTLKWSREFDTTNPWTSAGGVQPQDWPGWMRGFKDY